MRGIAAYMYREMQFHGTERKRRQKRRQKKRQQKHDKNEEKGLTTEKKSGIITRCRKNGTIWVWRSW